MEKVIFNYDSDNQDEDVVYTQCEAGSQPAKKSRKTSLEDDKQISHNMAEKMRRATLTQATEILASTVFKNVQKNVSRIKVLRKATEYIQTLDKKSTDLERRIDELEHQNSVLVGQNNLLKRRADDLEMSASFFASATTLPLPLEYSAPPIDEDEDLEYPYLRPISPYLFFPHSTPPNRGLAAQPTTSAFMRPIEH